MKLPSLSIKNHPLFNCGNPNCPICSKAYSFMNIKKKLTKLKENFQTDAVTPFVGRYNYPNINVGILTPPENESNSELYDSPRTWSKNNIQIPKIIDYRSALLNSRTILNTKQQNKYLTLNQEIALASKPVDIEINLKEKPNLRMNFDSYAAPQGPRGKLKKAELTENPNIKSKPEKVYSDTDLKADKALIYLYKNKFDENYLSRILSVGTIGIKPNRKLVPTRWSITATDDTLGKYLIKKIQDYNQINYTSFFGGYLGNYYLILTFPEPWGYELFETHINNINSYMTDHEYYNGRKTYATNTAGGYYSVRLAVLEKLNQLKRQGTCIVIRIITGDYTLPLGVWLTREAARIALNNNPLEFASIELMLKYAKALIKKKFNADISKLLSKSILLNNLKKQSKLTSFY